MTGTEVYRHADLAELPLNEPTYVRIKRAIIRDLFAREFRPGSHITIDKLTRKYRVSHMPVREALRQLEGEGVIISQAHKGFRIAALSDDYIRNVYDIRIGIESLLARRAVESGTDEQLAHILAIHRRFLRDLDDADRMKATHTNVEFHQALYSIAENSEAMRALEGRTLVVRTFGSKLSGYRDADRAMVGVEHQKIADAIEACDAAGCGQAVFDHVAKARERLVERMIQENVIQGED